MTMTAPRWDLGNVFPGLESEEYKDAVSDLKPKIDHSQE